MAAPADGRDGDNRDRDGDGGGRGGDDRGADDPDGPCSIIDSVSEIGSQWRLVVLYDLQDGEKRFNELKRSTGASSRTLSRVLDDLGETGYVNRRLEEDAPVATYYSLTEKGRSLCPVFDAIEEWADEWIEPSPPSPDDGDGSREPPQQPAPEVTPE